MVAPGACLSSPPNRTSEASLGLRSLPSTAFGPMVTLPPNTTVEVPTVPRILTSPPKATTASVTVPLTVTSPPNATTDGVLVPAGTRTSSPNCTSAPRWRTMAGPPVGVAVASAFGDAALALDDDAALGVAVSLVAARAGPASASPSSTSTAASATSASDGRRILATRSSFMVSPPRAFTVGSSRPGKERRPAAPAVETSRRTQSPVVAAAVRPGRRSRQARPTPPPAARPYRGT